jgi:SOS-response transcriptional repressor LexA
VHPSAGCAGRGGVSDSGRPGMGVQVRDIRGEVLGFVVDYIGDQGYAPSYDEIRASVGLSSRSHAKYYLTLLEGEGLIERTPRSPRSLRLVGSAGDASGASTK